MHGCSGGVCVVAPGGGMHGCSGGHTWLLPEGVHGCSGGHAWLLPGGMCMVAPRGACVVAPGGDIHGCSGVCIVAPRGACMVAARGACVVAPAGGGGGAWYTTRYGVGILLKCILVLFSKRRDFLPIRLIRQISEYLVKFLLMRREV